MTEETRNHSVLDGNRQVGYVKSDVFACVYLILDTRDTISVMTQSPKHKIGLVA